MDGMPNIPAAPDPQALNDFIGRMLGDLGAAMAVPLVRLGDELGLYAALDGAGPTTSAQLAERTGVYERLLREWLNAHAAAGYLDYDAASATFLMTPEQAMVFARPNSPVYLLGAFEVAAANVLDQPKVARAFRAPGGRGAGYGARCNCLFTGMARFFRAGYEAHLLQDWLPALDGVVQRLTEGGLVADIGCGHGSPVVLMARAFPNSRFFGFDDHAASIACATQAAALAGVADNTSFGVAGAGDFVLEPCDLIACFDALHDMGDPVGIAARIRRSLRPDGTFMLVEPRAGDRVEDNLNPVGRLYYAGSTMICTPVSLDQPGAAALGAQAGPARLTEILRGAGFTRVRLAMETPFNLVMEARP